METETERKLEDEITNTVKTITIKTTRASNNQLYSRYFPEKLNYRAHISEVEFSNPVTDSKRRLTNKLTLKTAWFKEAFGQNPFWMQILDDEEGYNLFCGDNFGQLTGDFSDYSKSRLERWQKFAYKRHKTVLDEIEKLYYSGENVLIPNELFD